MSDLDDLERRERALELLRAWLADDPDPADREAFAQVRDRLEALERATPRALADLGARLEDLDRATRRLEEEELEDVLDTVDAVGAVEDRLAALAEELRELRVAFAYGIARRRGLEARVARLEQAATRSGDELREALEQAAHLANELEEARARARRREAYS